MEISKISGYQIFLNVLQLLIVGIVADSVPKFRFSLPCFSSMFLFAYVADYDIYRVKTIACEAVFQFTSNLNVFKGVVIIYLEIVGAFTSFITTIKRT